MFALTFGILQQASFPVNMVISALTGACRYANIFSWITVERGPSIDYDKTLMAEFSASAGRSANSAVAKRVVMADVARLAGVSQQTVSRVVNDSPKLRPETRRRVQEAVERLGYRPNVAAQTLVRGRTSLIGLISTGFNHFGPSTMQHSIEGAARDRGLIPTSITLSEVTRAALDASVEDLLRQLAEGIIIIAGQDHALDWSEVELSTFRWSSSRVI
jgi:transcriptional regulator with XRE-family HTH domain